MTKLEQRSKPMQQHLFVRLARQRAPTWPAAFQGQNIEAERMAA
jgi:hypothetical protein